MANNTNLFEENFDPICVTIIDNRLVLAIAFFENALEKLWPLFAAEPKLGKCRDQVQELKQTQTQTWDTMAHFRCDYILEFFLDISKSPGIGVLLYNCFEAIFRNEKKHLPPR